MIFMKNIFFGTNFGKPGFNVTFDPLIILLREFIVFKVFFYQKFVSRLILKFRI
jgi:hypothetical protein